MITDLESDILECEVKWAGSLVREDTLEEVIATHFSILT